MWLAGVAFAGSLDTIEDWFPPEPLTADQAQQLLAADKVGPPARNYDEQTRSPGAPTDGERQVEAKLGLDDIAACDAQRRYARLLLATSRVGAVEASERWFLAEHVGLADVPEVFFQFVVGKGDVDGIVDYLRAPVADLRHDGVGGVAVTLAEDPAEPDQWVGLATALTSAARFEPFPRALKPGDVAIVPGTLLSGREHYALYVDFPGREVRQFPIEASGAFDIEIPTPTEPGRYRVALQQFHKGTLPDTPFFFTLYVGTEPPTSYVPGDWGGGGHSPAADQVEQEFVEALAAARGVFQEPPPQRVDATLRLRDALAKMPVDASPRKQKRWLDAAMDADLLAGIPHGGFQAVFGSGHSGAAIAWSVVEHPVTRASALDPDFSLVAVGAIDRNDGTYDAFGVLAAPAVASADSRQQLWDALAAKFTGPPSPAPKLEAALDALAAEVASGKLSTPKALKKIGSVAKSVGMLQGYGAWGFVAGTGQLPDVGDLAIDPRMRALAIGHADGAGSAGMATTVLLVVAAPQAQ